MARMLQYDPVAFLLYCRDKDACHQITGQTNKPITTKGFLRILHCKNRFTNDPQLNFWQHFYIGYILRYTSKTSTDKVHFCTEIISKLFADYRLDTINSNTVNLITQIIHIFIFSTEIAALAQC